MSYKATMEFGLHLHEFNNVDLFQQGIYFLRFQLYHQDSKGRIIYAQPYNQITCEEHPDIEKKTAEKKSQQKGFARQFGEGQIEDEIFAFSTQKFPIRFCEETVPLNLMLFWRTDVEAYPEYSNAQFMLSCELVCADFSSLGRGQGTDKGDDAFKTVSKFQCLVHNAGLGIHEYIPIQFSGNHYCQAEATFHSILLDFKFKLSDYQLELMSNTGMNGKKESTGNGIGNAMLIQPSSFLEFLNKITDRFKDEIVQQFYVYYVIGLRQGYNNLKKVISSILERFPELKTVSATLNEPIVDLPPPEFFPMKDSRRIPLFAPNSTFLKSQQLSNTKSAQQISNDRKPQKPLFMQQSMHQQEAEEQITRISSIFKLDDFKQMESFSKFVLADMNIVSGHLFQLWNKMNEVLRIDGDRSIKMLRLPYIVRMKEKWGESVRREKFNSDITTQKEKKTGKEDETFSDLLRQKLELMIENSEQFSNLVDLNLIPPTNSRPFFLEEIYTNPYAITKPISHENYKKSHVIILCHGFQGNSFDMRLMKNNLYLMYPNFLLMCSKANEDSTNGDISDMGKRLASEVVNYIKEWCPNDKLGRLSFIGHSLGGVIIRAALPHLQVYSDKMYLYMSLSSPHLGYMYNSSKLIEAGIWYLKTTRKIECLKQLHMSDSEQLSDCFLYRLTNQPGLNWFRNIALLSSYQDQYVPFESARIQKCDQASNQDAKGRLYNSMVDNLLGQLRTNCIHRIDVNFKIQDTKTIKKAVDNMIGRSAHLQFLESDALAKTIAYCFEHLFIS